MGENEEAKEGGKEEEERGQGEGLRQAEKAAIVQTGGWNNEEFIR